MGLAANKIKNIARERFAEIPDYDLATLARAPDMAAVVWEIRRALEKDILPERNSGGTTECYIMKSCEREPIAIFKPNGYPLKHEIIRELAAFQLDHGSFAGVPSTVLATFEHPELKGRRHGSCQLYVSSSDTLIGRNRLRVKALPAADIRRIALFDMRVLNHDRHGSNMLFNHAAGRSIPIDHGNTLPERFFGAHFVWLDWPQAATPFSHEEKKYIAALNPMEDVRILQSIGVPTNAVLLSFLANYLLKKGVARGLTARELGERMVRKCHREAEKFIWDPAPFEKVVEVLKEPALTWEILAKRAIKEIKKIL